MRLRNNIGRIASQTCCVIIADFFLIIHNRPLRRKSVKYFAKNPFAISHLYSSSWSGARTQQSCRSIERSPLLVIPWLFLSSSCKNTLPWVAYNQWYRKWTLTRSYFPAIFDPCNTLCLQGKPHCQDLCFQLQVISRVSYPLLLNCPTHRENASWSCLIRHRAWVLYDRGYVRARWHDVEVEFFAEVVNPSNKAPSIENWSLRWN